MVKTVAQGFQELRQRLEITDLQASTVSTRQQRVREAVKNELDVLDDFLTGSYMRNTMIAPLNQADIDIFAVLDPIYYREDGQAYILDKVRDVLKKTYKTPDISRDGQAVTISFEDFKVDVVPAFNLTGGGFYIANTILKCWIATDPRKHVTLWSAANKAHNDNLIPLIKMIKGWNKQNGSSLYSFHLECLILQILQNFPDISDFPSVITYTFKQAHTYIKYGVSISDPTGYNSNIGAYLNTPDKVNAVVSRLETAYNRAKKAEEYLMKGNIADAFYCWGQIFGEYFPAY